MAGDLCFVLVCTNCWTFSFRFSRLDGKVVGRWEVWSCHNATNLPAVKPKEWNNAAVGWYFSIVSIVVITRAIEIYWPNISVSADVDWHLPVAVADVCQSRLVVLARNPNLPSVGMQSLLPPRLWKPAVRKYIIWLVSRWSEWKRWPCESCTLSWRKISDLQFVRYSSDICCRDLLFEIPESSVKLGLTQTMVLKQQRPHY